MLRSGALGGEVGHANPADVVDTPSTPRSTQPPPTPTGTGVTVPAFDRGRFAAVIPLPGAGSLAVGGGSLWVATMKPTR